MGKRLWRAIGIELLTISIVPRDLPLLELYATPLPADPQTKFGFNSEGHVADDGFPL